MVLLHTPSQSALHLEKCHLWITAFFDDCSSHHHSAATHTAVRLLLASESALKDWARKSSRAKQHCCRPRNHAKFGSCVVQGAPDCSELSPRQYSCFFFCPTFTTQAKHVLLRTPLCRLVHNLPKSHPCITTCFDRSQHHHPNNATRTIVSLLLASGSAANDRARKSSRATRQSCRARNHTKLGGCVVVGLRDRSELSPRPFSSFLLPPTFTSTQASKGIVLLPHPFTDTLTPRQSHL